MFKSVKSRLTLLFTGSLLVILVVFIVTLYFFITAAIKNMEVHDLNRFYEEEVHEWAEELEEHQSERRYEYEHEKEHLDYEPEKVIFYYVFDENDNLVDGEETVRNFSAFFEKEEFLKKHKRLVEEVQLENSHLLVAYYPLEEDHQITGSVIVGKDITDEKHLIQKIVWILILLTLLFSILFAGVGYLFAGQAMKPIQKSFMTQKKFVSDASHELRTPLSIFYSSLEVLDKEEKDKLSSFGQEVLTDMKNEAELMNNLLNDLLFLARNDQDYIELDIQKVNLSILLEDLLRRFSRILPSSIALETNIEESTFMQGDPTRLQQLFYILLDNASRYTKTGTISCMVARKEKQLMIKITDTGIGISPKDIPYIFDRFFRADPSRSRKGSGLGLSIAKTIVDAHNGKISVNSKLGQGTEFTIFFPYSFSK